MLLLPRVALLFLAGSCALKCLGLWYETGKKGLSKDLAKAKTHYATALVAGDTDAFAALARVGKPSGGGVVQALPFVLLPRSSGGQRTKGQSRRAVAVGLRL